MDSPLRIFMSCGEIMQGSHFEVLFHQLPDGAVPKLATDRKMMVDGRPVRVSLTTDSGLAHYPARLLDMYRQADVVVFLYSMVDREAFEALPERFEWVTGPARDFEPVTFVMLGLIPASAAIDATFVISPQEVESTCSQYSVTNFSLDMRVKHKDLDDLWSFAARCHLNRVRSSSSAAASAAAAAAANASSSSSSSSPYHASGGGSSGGISGSGSSSGNSIALSPRSQLMAKEETLVQLTTTLITKKEAPSDLVKAMASQTVKKTEKILKQAIKATGKREILSISPSRIDVTHATLLVPTILTFTISTTSKTPLSWSIGDAETLTNAHFFSIHESQGTVSKSKPYTVQICCTFYQPSELSRFILVDCPQEPGLAAPLFVKIVAPLQPRDPLSYWTIDRKAISIGFRISSTLSANVYRSTLYGAVVAVKEWSLDPITHRPPDLFYTEWDAFVKLKHPNIAQFLGGSKERGEAFMVLEYLKHGQLGTFLHNPPPRGVVRTIDLRLKMATDLAKAMAYLHSQKMLHRDLTSANVLVDSDCSVKLGDFGEPRQVSAASSLALNATFDGRSTISGGGSSGGMGHNPLDWTAPELLTSSSSPGSSGGGVSGTSTSNTSSSVTPHTQKSDVFSYGVILWEFGAERVPARTLADVKNGVLPSLPMDIKTRYPSFNELVLQCTNVSPDMRPTFDEIVARLEQIRANGPATLAPTPIGKATTPGTTPPPSSRYQPPPAFNPNATGTTVTSAAPSRILYRGQVHSPASSKVPPSHIVQNNAAAIASSGNQAALPPSSQKVDSIILPDISIGPGQASPPALISPSINGPKPIHMPLGSQQQGTTSNQGRLPTPPLSLTSTAENGFMPASGPVKISPPPSQGHSPQLGQHALQGSSGLQRNASSSPPPSVISPRDPSVLSQASSGIHSSSGLASPPRSPISPLQTTPNVAGGLLPAAVPLTAPGLQSGSNPQFSMPNTPVQYQPPQSNGAVDVLGNPSTLPLLRLPSLSQFNGQPNLPASTLLSPQSSAAASSNPTSTSGASSANAKDDNLLNWASDVYDTHTMAEMQNKTTVVAPGGTRLPAPGQSVPSTATPSIMTTTASGTTTTPAITPRVPFVPAPLFSPRFQQQALSPRSGAPQAAHVTGTSPNTTNPLSNNQ